MCVVHTKCTAAKAHLSPRALLSPVTSYYPPFGVAQREKLSFLGKMKLGGFENKRTSLFFTPLLEFSLSSKVIELLALLHIEFLEGFSITMTVEMGLFFIASILWFLSLLLSIFSPSSPLLLMFFLSFLSHFPHWIPRSSGPTYLSPKGKTKIQKASFLYCWVF